MIPASESTATNFDCSDTIQKRASMNQRQCSGALSVVTGTVYESLGRLVGNRNLAHAGVTLQIRGRSQIAIGDAQKIIKSCVKRTQLSA